MLSILTCNDIKPDYRPSNLKIGLKEYVNIVIVSHKKFMNLRVWKLFGKNFGMSRSIMWLDNYNAFKYIDNKTFKDIDSNSLCFIMLHMHTGRRQQARL